jgi:malonate-semialdehyde dehydrogenase (acetylating)/methylmalonate-semialdehyde dehydrogenase
MLKKNVFQQAIRFNATCSAILKVPMYIDGKFVESKTNDWIDVHNPATNEVISKVPKCTQSEMEHAVESSKAAYKLWSKTSVMRRQQIMFRYQEIIKANMKKLSENITKEQGKTLIDAEGDVTRGLRKIHYVLFHCITIYQLIASIELCQLNNYVFLQRLLKIVAILPAQSWANHYH